MKATEISKNTAMTKENGIIINGKKYVATAGSSCENVHLDTENTSTATPSAWLLRKTF